MLLANEFIFRSFDDAMNIHKKMFEILKEKGAVSYEDLYSAIYDCEINNPEYKNYGWTKLLYAKVEPYKNGKWILKMPPEIIRIK